MKRQLLQLAASCGWQRLRPILLQWICDRCFSIWIWADMKLNAHEEDGCE